MPLSGAEAAQHFSPSLLSAIPLDGLNPILTKVAGPAGLELVSYRESGSSANAVVTGGNRTWLMDVAVDGSGLIAGLNFQRPSPTSWDELKARLRALAPDVSFLAAEVTGDGTCEPVEGVSADTARPLGSAFKLYVLGALARAVRTGRAGWDTQLAIRDDWKSLPSGELQNLPAGTELPLSTYADKMISISDNTATDHLIHFLGRPAVERQQQRFGMENPRANEPFLTTRELFQLKLNDYPSLAVPYEHLDREDRRDYLSDQVDPLPLPALNAPWTDPRKIDSLEWFASPTDICNAYSGLRRQARNPALAGVGHALSINDAGIGLDPRRWKTVWFKGGSEPGVLTLNFLATTTEGHTFVVSAMVSDPKTAFDEDLTAAEA
ncbi:MAG TPA: serine hydrolase, partial [Actinomycetota bacterium]|nr:serine hydrolase [Actinomycetota bacterium]